MSKFNTTATRPTGTSPITTEARPSGATHEGGPGYARDAKSELFLLAVSNLVGEETFYEAASERDTRYRHLIHDIAVDDIDWLSRFLTWLRAEANMRSAPVVGALEAVRARLAADLPTGQGENRSLVDNVLRRADEPGEALAYWTARYGRAIPKPVKRGVADAVGRLYTERNLAKWDAGARGFRFGDVIELVHPSPDKGAWQGDLFKHAIDRRHNRDNPIPESLTMLRAREQLLALPVEQRRDIVLHEPGRFAEAGMTWEALAGWLQAPMDAAAWEAIIPTMGYMALLRNLRNFDTAGVSDQVAYDVAARLADPEQVAKSRQFPFRFLSAYRAAPSLRWAWHLEQALGHSLDNVPTLLGRTLVLVDRSGSMFNDRMSARSDLTRADGAAVFGSAIALRAEHADLVEFGTRSRAVKFNHGESVLKVVDRFGDMGGTNTVAAVQAHLRDGHDRVIIVTDEQSMPDYGWRGPRVGEAVPANVPLYTWNLAGYRHGHAPSGTANRHTFGGLSDKAFTMVPLLEAADRAAWPF